MSPSRAVIDEVAMRKAVVSHLRARGMEGEALDSAAGAMMCRICDGEEPARWVLEEFAERAGQCVQVGDIYSPPFRDRLPDDTLGPEHLRFEFDGEERPNAQWAAAKAEWDMRPWWDPEQERAENERAVVSSVRHRVERPDAELLARWMRTHSHQVPRRELEVYTLFYVDGCTRVRTARKLGISIETVRMNLKGVRRRAGITPGCTPSK